jgi:hypothetical protein
MLLNFIVAMKSASCEESIRLGGLTGFWRNRGFGGFEEIAPMIGHQWSVTRRRIRVSALHDQMLDGVYLYM